MSEKKRVIWIDQLRGVAFYFVIVGHLLSKGVLENWIYSFHMPLFFLITGFTFNVEKTSKTKFYDLVSTLAKRILLPYVYLEFISLFIKGVWIFIDMGKIVDVPKYLFGVLVGNGNIVTAPAIPLYYLLLLFLARIGLWALIKLFKGNKIYVGALLIVINLISYFTERKAMVWHVNVVPTAMLYIFIGCLIMTFYNKCEPTLKRLKEPVYFTVTGILFAAGFALAQHNGRTSIHANAFGDNYIFAVTCAVLTSVAWMLLVIKLPEVKVLDFVGKNTLFLLGIHEASILVIRNVFADHWQKGWFVAVVSVLFYFLPIPLAWLFKTYAPYVCGGDLKEKSLPVLLMKYVTLALCFFVPWFYMANKLTNGALYKGNVTLRLLCAAGLVVIVVLVERLILIACPVLFGEKRKVKKQPAEALETDENKQITVEAADEKAYFNYYDDDGIIIINPTEADGFQQ